MKTSKALKLTRKKLWNGINPQHRISKRKQVFVCYASEEAGVDDIVRPIVMALIAPHGSIEIWLQQKYGIVSPRTNFRKLQKTRHKWVKHLIKHYKRLGD